MAMFTFSVFIDHPQQEVFDLLSNPRNLEQWPPLMQPAAWTSSGESGVRSTGRGIMKTAGQDRAPRFEVTRYDPPHRYDLKILNAQFPFEVMQYVYILEPQEGGTRITLHCESEWVRSY